MDAHQDIQEYYALGRERDRLERGEGLLEALRTHELLERWLPAAPAVVYDVGGAAGRYAIPLAEAGYDVHLVDPVPLHLEQAREASDTARRPLASVVEGDARALPFPDDSADAVLLLGPLYHLVEREDRLRAISEAARVLRPGGVLVAAGISRFASAVDGLLHDFLRDDVFAQTIADDVAGGVHRNPTRRPGWFTTSYFHRPDELRAEVEEAGLVAEGPVAVEGIGRLADDLDALLSDPVLRVRLLDLVRATETEPTLLGVTGHLLVAGRVS